MAVRKFGRAAVPGLLRAAENDEELVRKLAAFTLAGIEPLTPAELPALMKAHERRHNWALKAIARIGTPQAIEFVLTRDSSWCKRASPSSDESKLFSKKLLVDPSPRDEMILAELLGAVESGDPTTKDCLFEVFDILGPRAEVAIPPLVAIAANSQESFEVRDLALSALAGIGPVALQAQEALLRIVEAEPALMAKAVRSALTEMGQPDAVRCLIEDSPHYRQLTFFYMMLSEHYTPRICIGPVLVERLRQAKTWDEQLGAARALGFIGYAPATPLLIEQLTRQDDWRIVWAAAESLGRLRAKEARKALAQLSVGHWYPPVREASRQAIASIDGIEPYGVEENPDGLSEFWRYMNLDFKGECDCWTHPFYRHTQAFPSANQFDEARARGLVWNSEGFGYEVAFQLEDGWLLGSSRGEWGGELFYADDTKVQYEMLRDNIHGIFRLGQHIVVLTGIAHLSVDRGMLHEVVREADGKYTVRPWRVLPGAPGTRSITEDQRLFVRTSQGDILIDENGNMTMATCPPPSS